MSTPLELWERLAQLPGGSKDPFADPYGPTDECFSANDVVRMLKLGAESRYVVHLTGCKACEARIEAFGSVMEQSMIRAVPHRKHRWGAMFSGAKPPVAAVRPRTLVYVPSECVVKDGEVESIRVELLTKQHFEVKNVWLRGAVTAEASAFVLNDAGYPSVVLHNVRASKELLHGLRRHSRFTTQLEVSIGETPEHPRVTGTSNIDFRRFDPKTDVAVG